MIETRTFRAIGTTCAVLAEHTVVDAAADIVKQQVAELDQACSRFRDDSELSSLVKGTTQSISPLLTDILAAALRTASQTDGLVDLTVGSALAELGYDDDFDQVRARTMHGAEGSSSPAPGYWRIALDQQTRQVLVPRGVDVDLGASAKAWAADRAARTCSATLPGGFLVNLGGDIAVGGPSPDGGWQVDIEDTHAALDEPSNVDPSQDRPVVSIHTGGLATSSTAVRTWRQGERLVHHIVDPRTGSSADRIWRAVSVAASTCELANAASTAAIVLGLEAPQWLAQRGLPARLVSTNDKRCYVGGWPVDEVDRWMLSA